MNLNVRVGVGGWTYPPWRGPFYPKGLKQADELAWSSRRLGAIEINATYHSLHTPESFAKWAAQTPEDFVFAVKASRFCTNRRVLAEAGEAIDRFIGQGLEVLGQRLGPILWQFMPTKTFDADDFARFVDLLPERLGSLTLRHCIEPRHPSFADPHFLALCRARDVAVCLSDHGVYPQIEGASASFAYARLMRLNEDIETGYPPDGLADWARRLQALAQAPPASADQPRDVFAFFIGAGGEGKVRAPAAALGLISALGAPTASALDRGR
jgi:uncharacterized protein YecE (DUF72 family)